MDCACMYVPDYDSPQFFREKMVKARKEHKCCECQRAIEPGETYEYSSGMWDGRLDQHKTCSDCVSVRANFCCDGYLFESLWEGLWEHVSELQGQLDSSCIVSLTPKAREKVCEMIEEVWVDLDEGEADE